MQSIRQVQRLNEKELEKAIPPSASWHTDYRDTAYIYIGGIPHELSEGDIIVIFSQYGDIVWTKLARDKETGKSRGFAWVKYEDQRSCDLAVDNLSGSTVLGRLLAVDHARYKKRDDEDDTEGFVGQVKPIDNRGEFDTESHGKRRPRREIQNERDSTRMIENVQDQDPMKEYISRREKDEHVSRKQSHRHSDKREHGHRSRRDKGPESSRRSQSPPSKSHSHRRERDKRETPRSPSSSVSRSRSRSPRRRRS